MPRSIAENRNIVLSAETKIRIRAPAAAIGDAVFGYTIGRMSIFHEKESVDDAEDCEYFHFDVVRKKLMLDVGFFIRTDMLLHVVPFEFMVESDEKGRVNVEVNESIEIYIYQYGLSRPPYYCKEFILDEFVIDTMPQEGGVSYGHIRGESNGPFEVPLE